VAAIAAVVGTLGAAFAYTAGWLGPSRVTSTAVINAFQSNAGIHPGYRRNHAKGLCIDGYFESNGAAASVSKAEVFSAGQRTPVIGRFAIPGSNPEAPDNSVPVRSMALLFKLANGEQWRTGMNSTPVFAVHTPQQFYQQLVALHPDPATGKPNPAKLKAFFSANPDTLAFRQWVAAHPPSSSFANAAYYSINAFYLVDQNGKRQAVRWSVQPELPYAPQARAEQGQPSYLAADLQDRLAAGSLRWHLMLTLGEPGDPTDDATRMWPADRPQIDAGTLVIEHARAQEAGTCRDVNFDPTILPNGIEPSNDPLLAARSAAYALSYKRRTREEAIDGVPSDQAKVH
jgi:catalase